MSAATLLAIGPNALSGISAKTMEEIDRVEEALSRLPIANCPLTHLFTPGIYLRKIFMPAMSMVTSKIHKTEHPFIILKGTVSVKNGDGDPEIFEAPYIGVTKPGTRRVLFCHTDVEWATVHATDKQNVEEIEEEILEYHRNPFLQHIESQ